MEDPSICPPRPLTAAAPPSGQPDSSGHSDPPSCRHWVEETFSDFCAVSTPEALGTFRESLAAMTATAVATFRDAQAAGGTDPAKALVTSLVTAAQSIDDGHVRCPDEPLRSYLDASVPGRVLWVFFNRLPELLGAPELEALALARLAAAIAPGHRGALIALARLQIAHGQLEEAVETCRRALALASACNTAQRLLLRAAGELARVRPEQVPREIATDDLSDRFCSRPFEALTITGDAYVCDCGAWLPYPVGSLAAAGSAEELWNSATAQELRRSILDGSFRYCSRTLCPAILGGTLARRSEVRDPLFRRYLREGMTVLEEGPRQVQLSFDVTCNLACPSCRTGLLAADSAEQQRFSATRDRLILPLLERVDGTVYITGWGDPFASPSYRSILARLNPEEFPHLGVILATNGLLLDEDRWRTLNRLHPMIVEVKVSVDAALPETFERLRPPGRWTTLMQNLRFLSGLRRSGELRCLTINFVVQAANFEEIVNFVRLGLDLEVDGILIQKLMNMGTFDQSTFREIDVADPSHPLHGKLLRILADPLLRHPRVNAFNFMPLLAAAEAAVAGDRHAP